VTSTQFEAPPRLANQVARRIALTTPEAADYLGLAVSTLNKWRCHGGGPEFLKLGRAVRYRKDDLDRFVEARSFRSTAEI